MRFWSAKGVFNSPWSSQSSPLLEDGGKWCEKEKLRNSNFRFQEAPEESKKIILTSFKALDFTGHGRDRVGSHNIIYIFSQIPNFYPNR